MQDATAQMALACSSCSPGKRRDGGAHHRALRPPDPGAYQGADGRPGHRERTTNRRGLRLPAQLRRGATASASGGPGAGIIHQVVLEKYAFPGGMMIGTDSHTPNAGGLGMFACGVGGADAVDVMAGFPLGGAASAARRREAHGQLSRAGPRTEGRDPQGLRPAHGEGRYQSGRRIFRPGTVESISCTGKATITNMGAELGATTSIFPYGAAHGDLFEGDPAGGAG